MDAATLVMMVLLAVIVFGIMGKLLWNIISGKPQNRVSHDDDVISDGDDRV